jgi:hypothetical protein
MIDKNEDHSNDKQHVSFHNNIKPKLKSNKIIKVRDVFISYMFVELHKMPILLVF